MFVASFQGRMLWHLLLLEYTASSPIGIPKLSISDQIFRFSILISLAHFNKHGSQTISEREVFLKLWGISVITVGFTHCYFCSFSCELGWFLQSFCPSHSIYTISMPNLSVGRWMSKYQSYCWESSGINWYPKCDKTTIFLLFLTLCS